MSVKKAVGYVRVSRVGAREGDSFLSPELQREQIAAVARREGLRVVEVLEELDASGGDPRGRSGTRRSGASRPGRSPESWCGTCPASPARSGTR